MSDRLFKLLLVKVVVGDARRHFDVAVELSCLRQPPWGLCCRLCSISTRACCNQAKACCTKPVTASEKRSEEGSLSVQKRAANGFLFVAQVLKREGLARKGESFFLGPFDDLVRLRVASSPGWSLLVCGP